MAAQGPHAPHTAAQLDVGEGDQGDAAEAAGEIADALEEGDDDEEPIGFRRFVAQTKRALRGEAEDEDDDVGERGLGPEAVIIVKDKEPSAEPQDDDRELSYAELKAREKARDRAVRRYNRARQRRALLVARRWWIARACSAAALGAGLGLTKAVELQMYAAAGNEMMLLNPIITLATVPIVWTVTKAFLNTVGRILTSALIPAIVGYYGIEKASQLSGQDLKAMLLANPQVHLYVPFASAGVIAGFGLWLHFKTRRWWRPASPGLWFCSPQWLLVDVVTMSAIFSLLHFSTND
ncbi:hypothetical protein [Streptomyces noursei]|uniref:hypothetical protein n=1 Tax=Streptomyces noursei TaxID=1971 RepID=UPI00380BD559